MRKYLKSFFLILIANFSAWFGYADVTDPAILISRTKTDKDIIISAIENHHSEVIYLKAGNEKFGLNHILRKHSPNYFTDNQEKGKLFPVGTTGKQIIEGIENVFKNGQTDPKSYGNKKVLKHHTSINGKDGTYRLVINEDNEIITFFRLRNKI